MGQSGFRRSFTDPPGWKKADDGLGFEAGLREKAIRPLDDLDCPAPCAVCVRECSAVVAGARPDLRQRTPRITWASTPFPRY
jgi:hypothetical protein